MLSQCISQWPQSHRAGTCVGLAVWVYEAFAEFCTKHRQEFDLAKGKQKARLFTVGEFTSQEVSQWHIWKDGGIFIGCGSKHKPRTRTTIALVHISKPAANHKDWATCSGCSRCSIGQIPCQFLAAKVNGKIVAQLSGSKGEGLKEFCSHWFKFLPVQFWLKMTSFLNLLKGPFGPRLSPHFFFNIMTTSF